MKFILIGLSGFFLIHLSDWAAIKKVPALKPVSWVAGGALFLYSLILSSSFPVKFYLPAWTMWLGWPMLAISIFLTIYSLFINLPFRKTYVATGVGEKLIKTGLYAIVRHPGVMSLALFMLSLLLVTKSSLLLIAVPVFILADITLVVIQDRFLFSLMFPGYEGYRRETPMLLPNRRSLKAFIESFKQLKGSGRVLEVK